MKETYPNIKQSIFLVFLLIALQFSGGIIIGIFSAIIGNESIIDNPLVISLLNIVSYFLVCFLGYRKSGKHFTETFNLNRFKMKLLIPVVIITIGLGIICSEIDNIVRIYFPMPDFIHNLHKSLVYGGLGTLFLLSFVAPLTEEFFFRGLVLNALLSKHGITKSFLVSSLLFMIVHLNPYQFLSAFLIGMLSAWIFYLSNSLWPSIFCHFIVNFQIYVALNWLSIKIPGYNTEFSPMATQFQPMWFDLFGLFLFIAGIYLFFRMSIIGTKSTLDSCLKSEEKLLR